MKKYSIGLDIGTNSVGWACVDEQYQILKHRGRYAYGVHEFDSGKTAAETRIKRGTRRRYNRRRRRIQLLQQLWAPILENSDKFFSLQDEATTWRQSNQFEEKSLTHVLKTIYMYPNKYLAKYPTIYHLRVDLLNNKQKVDLRLVYLAVHNLVKHRGHFLNGSEEWHNHKGSVNVEEALSQFITEYQEITNDGHIIEQRIITEIISTFDNNKISKSEKLESIKQIVPASLVELIKLLLNLSTSFTKLFPTSDQSDYYKELKDNAKFNIGDEELLTKLDVLLESEKSVIEQALALYQQLQLKKLLDGNESVAEAKVAAFKSFKRELEQLKILIRTYGTEEDYRKLFITSKENWRAYKHKPDIHLLCALDRYTVHSKSNNGMKDMIGSSDEKKDNKNTQLYFYVNVREILINYKSKVTKAEDLKQIDSILQRIVDNNYMLKQISKDNAAIPVQNAMFEARTILNNQAYFHSQITDQFIEEVVQLIRFRIPYYVGPLIKQNTEGIGHRFGWAVRRKQGIAITPWNFTEVIDQSQTAEGFITRMTNKCTYLKQEDVLAKHSLLYQEFELLDELNRIQVRRSSEEKHPQHRLEPKLKLWLISEVFRKQNKVSHQDVLQAILRSPWREQYRDHYDGEGYQIYGTSKEKEFASKQTSYIKLQQLFGVLRESDYPFYEEIIRIVTIFNEENIIKYRLQEVQAWYPDAPILDEIIVAELVRWNITGWGKLSAKLLNGIPVYEHSPMTLIEVLRAQEHVFNTIKSPKHYIGRGRNQKEYSYLVKRIEHENDKHKHKKQTHRIKYADIRELQGSPSLKRGIWRAIRIVEELVNLFGEPQHIMLEVAREESVNKRRIKSREDQWKMRAASLRGTEYEQFYRDSKADLSADKFMQTKLWLYLNQGGKCLYTQEALDVNRLYSYQIDHIIPRSLIKDDSLDNLALVIGSANQNKGDLLVPLELIPNSRHYSIKQYWKSLMNVGLISRKKYENLNRKSITEIEINGFIERQLVETRQIIKHVQELLQYRFEQTRIHMVKAGIISKLRTHVQLPKSREINNKHHAIDALLVNVFIQSIIERYGDNYLQFKLSRKDLDQTLARQAQDREDFFLFRNFDHGKYPSNRKSNVLQSSREYLNEIMFELPWQTTYAIGSTESSFFNETNYSPKVKKNFEQVNGVLNHTEMTHENFNNIFSIIIEADEVKKKVTNPVRKIIDISLYDFMRYSELTEQELSEKIVEHLIAQKKLKPLINIKFIRKINKYQAIKYDGQPAYFISSGELRNAKQLILPRELYIDIAAIIDDKFMKDKGDKSDQLPLNYENAFVQLSEIIVERYDHLNAVKREGFEKVLAQLVDHKTNQSIFKDALKVSAANALRSDTLGGRWKVSIKPELIEFVYESITGLSYRK